MSLGPWTIDGTDLEANSLSVTHRTLTLGAEVTTSVDHWRQYDRSGGLQVVGGANGDYRAFDTSGGAQGPITVTPPTEWSPAPFGAIEVFVEDYSESQVAPGRFEIELSFQRASNIGRDVSDPGQAGTWEFGFSRGTIGLDGALDEQVLVAERDGDSVGDTWTLPLLLSDQQARVVIESLSHVGATAERTVPDGQNYVVDTTTTDRNTVELITPPRATVQSGTYVATGWDLAWYSHRRRWLVELSLSLIASSSGVFDLSFDTGLA
jgi:hypothetical protein